MGAVFLQIFYVFLLGLGVDNAQQFKVVLPNGTYVTSNRYVNQDLFFALRGGGGGTFGVVMEMSTLAHPDKPMQYARFFLPILNSDQTGKLLTVLVDNGDKWATEGFGANFVITSAYPFPSQLQFMTTLLSYNDTVASLKPVTDFVTIELGLPVGAESFTTYNGFYQTFQSMLTVDNAQGMGNIQSSRLVTRKYFQDDNLKSQLVSVLTGIAGTGITTNASIPSANLIILVVGPMLYSQNLPESDQPGGPGYASVTPAWRDTLWHVTNTYAFNPNGAAPSTIDAIFQKGHDVMQPLRELASDTGAYQNEADPFEPDPVGSYWGEENYQRLLAIKKEVDPGNLFTVHQGINWDPSDSRYSCYPSVN